MRCHAVRTPPMGHARAPRAAWPSGQPRRTRRAPQSRTWTASCLPPCIRPRHRIGPHAQTLVLSRAAPRPSSSEAGPRPPPTLRPSVEIVSRRPPGSLQPPRAAGPTPLAPPPPKRGVERLWCTERPRRRHPPRTRCSNDLGPHAGRPPAAAAAARGRRAPTYRFLPV
ncbi:MAG: hypothetical protein J3K34DRAFT_415177 [Monoraphidium minutum]|nr:MAG: hypothetical protein J3K34DRAFT_415177 [Monoraphidium minutum]